MRSDSKPNSQEALRRDAQEDAQDSSQPTSRQGSQPTSRQGTQPTSRQGSQPTSQQGSSQNLRPTDDEGSGRREGGAEEDIEEDSAGISEDPEMKRQFSDYRRLVKEIRSQNRTVDDLKDEISNLCNKSHQTVREHRDIQRFRNCLGNEIIKLQGLIKKAIVLQNTIPKSQWTQIPIATTLDEDNAEVFGGCGPGSWKTGCSEKSECTSPRKKNLMNDDLCELLRGMKGCDDEALRELAAALIGKEKRRRCKSPCEHKKHKCNRFDEGIMKRLAQNNMDLEFDRHSLHEEVLCRDKKIDALQERIHTLQKQLCRRKNEAHIALQQCNAKHTQVSSKEKSNVIRKLESGIDDMQLAVSQLHQEVKSLSKERDRYQELASNPMPCSACTKLTGKADEMSKLKNNYTCLLAEYAKKDGELKELKNTLRGHCGQKKGGGIVANETVEESELQLLRTQLTDLREEQEEFKCIVKEQSEQLEDYRNKYLAAQQKVEEQKCSLEKLNMSNKRIENQINMEVKQIKLKFQEKLNELSHYPKLLENEQLKLATVCKEKLSLEGKLHLVCKELKSIKSQLESVEGKPDCRNDLLRCKEELEMTKGRNEELTTQLQLLCDQHQTTKNDLDTLRSESAKIIARTKERAEASKQALQNNIDHLERELARCRASACLSVTDRETVIKDMQGQLNTLSYSFDGAQKQIKTLQNHIDFVSNEKCFPIKC